MVRLLVPFLVLALAVAASVLSDRPTPKADFTFINKNDVTTLDLQRMSWMQDLRVTRLLYEGLVRNNLFTWEYTIEPAVADRWEISADRKTYTFHIRDEARWSNGERVRASDFVYSWRRALLPDTASDYSGQFMLIKGGRAFFEGRQKKLDEFAKRVSGGEILSVAGRLAAAQALWDESLREFDKTVGVRATDDSTLVVELERPTPYFLDLCAFPVFFPVYPPLVRQYEHLNLDTGMMECEQGWTKPPVCVSNGPMELKVWRFKRDMRLEKNPMWWNTASLKIDSIGIPSIEDPNASVMAFRTRAVDWVSDVVARYNGEMLAEKKRFYREHQGEYDALVAQGLDPVEIDRRLPPDARKNIHVFPAFGTYFLNFNCSKKLPDGRENPFFDPRVRRAFTMVVDKKTITEEVRRLDEPESHTLIPPGSIAGYTSPMGVRCISDAKDEAERREIIAEARQLLIDAGQDPKRFITVDMLFTKDGGHDVIFEAVAKNWREHLGVPVTLTQKEIKVFRDDSKNHNFMVCRGSWYGDYGDPTTFLDLNRTGDGNNDRNYSSAAYDALLEEGSLEADPAKRMEILKSAEKMVLDEAVLLPLFTYAQIYCFDANKFTGISSHPRSDQALYQVDVFGDGKGTDRPLMLPARGR